MTHSNCFFHGYVTILYRTVVEPNGCIEVVHATEILYTLSEQDIQARIVFLCHC